MKKTKIVQTALDNLFRNLDITGKWKPGNNPEAEGNVEFLIDDKKIKFQTEVKQELRLHQLPTIYAMANKGRPLMVVANNIFPKIKEELRQHSIAWMETNGNIFLRQNGVMLFVDGLKPLPETKTKVNRAFTKTGLKIIFQFLVRPNQLNYNQRHIAQITDVALGNVNIVFGGLKEMGFLVDLNKDERKLIDKKALIDKWVNAYVERLKPTLFLGTYRFIDPEQFRNYKEVQLLGNESMWGGEPAGDLLTDHLRPEILTIYTKESKADLLKKYRMIPGENGNIKVYQKFWQLENTLEDIVPKLLVYADLITVDDKRCRETAQLIFQKYLEPDL